MGNWLEIQAKVLFLILLIGLKQRTLARKARDSKPTCCSKQKLAINNSCSSRIVVGRYTL
jgi:hypothetical protein